MDQRRAGARAGQQGGPRARGEKSEGRLIASPCNKVCVMDAQQRYCLGCGRTLDEIARWSEMSDAERAAVIAALAARRPEMPQAR
ncbi:MAG: DUF1289 domain-containing protein [Burkholderiales bacterium]